MIKLWSKEPSPEQEKLRNFLALELQANHVPPNLAPTLANSLLSTLQMALTSGDLNVSCDKLKQDWTNEVAFWRRYQTDNAGQVKKLLACIETVENIYGK